MKRFLALALVVAILLAFISCGAQDKKYYAETPRPDNGIFDAPETFYRDWDIPSVRDASIVEEGYYSMPVYRIDTYAELLHLKDIVGMDLIGNEVENEDFCETCQTAKICAHKQYTEEFFNNYSLLIGWCQYKGLILPEHVETASGDVQAIKAEYTVTRDGDLVVNLIGENADPETELTDEQQWILVAVPKYKVDSCNKITFLVKLPIEGDSDNTTDETLDETVEQGREEQ